MTKILVGPDVQTGLPTIMEQFVACQNRHWWVNTDRATLRRLTAHSTLKLCTAAASSMLTPMIHVVATITVKLGQRARFLAEFHSIVAPTLAENGCLRYQPTVDISPRIHAKQVDERAEVVTIIETWRDIPALEAHLAAPHMAAYRERVKELVVSGALQITQDATH